MKHLRITLLAFLLSFGLIAGAEDLTNLTTGKLSERIVLLEKKIEELEVRLAQSSMRVADNVGQAPPSTLQEQKQKLRFASEEFEDVAVSPEGKKQNEIVSKPNSEPDKSLQLSAGSKDERKNEDDPVSKAGNLISAGKYEDAEAILLQFIDDPDDAEIAERANIFYGEMLMGKKQYDLAASQLISTYHKYPSTNRTPVTLINLATALHKGGKKREACATLSKLHREFPDLNSILVKAATDVSTTSGCTK